MHHVHGKVLQAAEYVPLLWYCPAHEVAQSAMAI
jgi:hypothetical protein